MRSASALKGAAFLLSLVAHPASAVDPSSSVVRVLARTQRWSPMLEAYLVRHGSPLPLRRDVEDRSSDGTAFATDAALMTAWHTVRGARKVQVVHDGLTVPARVVRVAPELDVAWLDAAVDLPTLRLGAVQRGDAVTLAGFSQGELRVVLGGVTGLYEGQVGSAAGPHWQLNVDVSQGMSGGPAWDADGAVVGMIVGGLGTSLGPGLLLPADRWRDVGESARREVRCPGVRPCVMRLPGGGWLAAAGESPD